MHSLAQFLLTFSVQETCLLIALLLFLPSSALAKSGNDKALDILRHAHQQMNLHAQETMDKCMQIALSWLNHYCLSHKHPPADSQELAFAQTELSKLMPANPYRHPSLVNETLENELNSTIERVAINVELNLSLSERYIEKVLQELPDDWQAPAGTIKIISNGYSLMLLWAAGADLRPIREGAGKPIILVLRLRP